MTDGWDIGPDIAKLTLRAVPGLPVTWPLTPIPDGWTPVQPVFEVRMGDGTVTSYPLTKTVLDGELQPVWVTVLTAEQTAEFGGHGRARLIDSEQVIAAGPFQGLSGWSPNITPVSMPARILAGPPGSGGAGGGGVTDHGALTGLADDDHQLYALADGTRGDFAPTSHSHDDQYYTEAEVDALLSGVTGGSPGPLAEFTALPPSPEQWQPYEYRITNTTTYPGTIQWATGAPTITGWGVVLLIWDGAAWRGEWVEMTTAAAAPGEVTPMEPTFTDLSGTANDRYAIPDQAGVEYRKNGVAIAAGEYTPTAGESITITAHATTGYTLTMGATASWSHTFDTVSTNTAPSMTLGAPTITGLEVSQPFTTFDADGDTVTVTADWGDGETGVVTSPAVHEYGSAGTYDATFTPSDGTADGAVRPAQYALTPGAPPVGNPLTLQDAMVAYGAAGYWKLNETTGTQVTDYSGNNRHLTLNGVEGTDYTLAGKDGFLHLQTATGYAGGTSDTVFSIPSGGHLTVFALVHLLNTSGGTARRVVSKRSSTQAEWGFVMHNLNPQAMVWRANPSVMLTQSTATSMIGANDWIAIAAKLPSDTSIRPPLWVNSGTPADVTSGGGTGWIGDGTAELRIGDGHIGAVAHVAVLPSDLTDAHIQKLMDLARAEGLIPT